MQVKALSSVGKKEIVAVSGILMLGFLAMHLLGNTTIYFGKEHFDKYAEHLHGLGILLNFAEVGLFSVFALHIGFALLVTYENLWARPVKYAAGRKNKAGLLSKLMPWTGSYTLVFLIVHLVNFRLQREGAHYVGDRTISQMVSNLYESPAWALFYFVSMIVVAMHVAHGLWSGFQTLGAGTANNRILCILRNVSVGFAILVGIGFGGIPIAVVFFLGS